MTPYENVLVGFDATPLEVRQRSGVSHSIHQLLTALAARDDRFRYVLLASRRLSRVPPGTLGLAGLRLPNRSLWMQLAVPFILARLRPELCHFTNSIAPLVGAVPFVLSLHDMSLFLHPSTQPRKSLFLVRSLIPPLARRAAAIITPSESARADVVDVLGVSASKVHAIYEAAAPVFRPVTDETTLDRVRRQYGLDAPYILAVGTLEPRKNLNRLVRAFAAIHRRGRAEQLLLVGQPGWKYRTLLREIEEAGLAKVVRLLGYVPDDDMPALYSLARLLAFPSLYEGFGLPIVECMACRVPVLTSDRSSMAELAGAAALLVDPTDVDAIEDGLMRSLDDEVLREGLIQAGANRAAEFSWGRTARETVEVYDRVLGQGPMGA